jgi:hypothetical protein
LKTPLRSWLSFLLLTILVVVATASVYYQVTNFEFIAFDEPDRITNNPNIEAGISFASLAWALTSVEGAARVKLVVA